jgi:hypothetical protein
MHKAFRRLCNPRRSPRRLAPETLGSMTQDRRKACLARVASTVQLPCSSRDGPA